MTEHDPRDALIEHLPALRAFAASLCKDAATADDMVQDTAEKAWRNFDSFRPGTNLRAWLFTILRNTYYSNRRKARREVADPEGSLQGQLAEKPRHDGHLQMTEFREAFAQLPDEQREALVLVGAAGFSYEEVADMCGCAVGTIKSRTNRARHQLARMLDLDAEEPLEMTETHTVAVVAENAAGPY